MTVLQKEQLQGRGTRKCWGESNKQAMSVEVDIAGIAISGINTDL